MKKTLLAAAVASLVSAGAFAQNTTISGSISTGIMDTGAPGDTAQVVSLGGGANAINIVTSEDLGGGVRAGFDGQIRFSSATGDRTSAGNGRALMHGANVFVTGNFGTVRLGKIIESNNCFADPWGCTGGASMVAGAAGTIGADGAGFVAGQTIQNAVAYATPTVNGFNFVFQSSLSGNPLQATTAANGGVVTGRNYERQVIALNFSQGPLTAQYLRSQGSQNVAADYTSIGRTGTTVASTTLAAIADDKREATAISGSYNLGFARVNAYNAISKSAAGAKTNEITSVSASIPSGAYTFLLGYSQDAIAAAAADTKWGLGVNYSLSKRTTIGADAFQQEGMAQVNGTSGGGRAGTGFVLRARHNF